MDFKNPLAETAVLNAGLVALMAYQGNDATPAEIARTSFRNNFKPTTVQSDMNLDDYLLRWQHATPYEFPDATFYMVMPIFVARQMVRHRTASINEESLRYVEPRAEFWIPSVEECKAAAQNKKQGSDVNLIDDPQGFIDLVRLNGEEAHHSYQVATKNLGVANELARAMLPVGQYTAWYWKASLRNIFGLLDLRAQNIYEDNHAQYQIQVYANAMLEQLRVPFPMLVQFFENHVLNSITFSYDEVCAMRHVLASLNYNNQHDTVAMYRGAAMANGLRETRIEEFLHKMGLD